MAIKAYRTPVELKNYMQILCDKAIENACNRLLGALQKIIDDEFYDTFTPSFYIRSYQFWRSATAKMFNQNLGSVYMDETAMNYNSFWTGEKQLLAASIGSHGGWVTDETKEHRFWEVFERYCEKNAVSILKDELKKVGLSIK